MRQFGWLLAACALTIVAFDAAAQTGRSGGAAAAPGGQRGATGQRAGGAATPARTSPGAGPVIVFETVKGTFEMETYPNEAPKSVEHILALVRRNFYNGQRVHRVVSGQLVQFGDPQTRDMTKQAYWGTGGSGRSVGAGEMSPKRKHVLGSVALAHAGDPRQADSQMYVMLVAQPKYDGDYTVVGQVISGLDVVRKLQVTDIIRRASIRGAPARGAAPAGR